MSLQAETSGRPVVLRVQARGGHGLGSTRDQESAALADGLVFLLHAFGLDDPDRRAGPNESLASYGPVRPDTFLDFAAQARAQGTPLLLVLTITEFAPEPPVYRSESRAGRRAYAGVAVPSPAHR